MVLTSHGPGDFVKAECNVWDHDILIPAIGFLVTVLMGYADLPQC